MPLSASDFQAWLASDNAMRCILVEVQVNTGSTETTLYLSNKNFTSGPSDTIPNLVYQPVISSSVAFTENISLDGKVTISYGDLEIDNATGAYDAWIDYTWVGRPINIYVGDLRSTRDSFNKVFSGTVADIGFSSEYTINISIRDILQRLNAPIYDRLLGNYGTKGSENTNKDKLRPLVFGEVHNITPLLVDDVLLTYMVHDGPIESIIEVRDNGVPVEFTANLTNGTFTLVNNPAGNITCSVQGDKYTVDATGIVQSGYDNSIARIIQRIITSFGKAGEYIVSSEMDLANFNLFDANNTQPVGIYLSERKNILEVVQELAGSVGAQLVTDRLGLLKLTKLQAPVYNAANRSITINDIYHNSFSVKEKVPVKASVKLGYCKNWTVQSDIVSGIPQEHKDLYSQEYLNVTSTDTVVKAKYKLTEEPVQEDTLLITNASGIVLTEATRRLNLFKVPRFVYNMSLTPKHLGILVGEIVTLTYPRFGLSAGKAGQVVSVSIDWDTGTTTVGVFV